jgi:hypothetical protein
VDLSICHSPEDKAKEAVEQSTHEREQVGEEWDSLANDKAKQPGRGSCADPDGPSFYCVVVVVSGAKGEPVEEVANDDTGVDDSDDDGGRQHKGETDLFEDGRQVGNGRGLCVLTTVVVHHDSHQGEEDELGDSDSVQGLGEVFRVLHLGNKAWVANLPDPCSMVGSVSKENDVLIRTTGMHSQVKTRLRKALKPATKVVPSGAKAVILTGSPASSVTGLRPCMPVKMRTSRIAMPIEMAETIPIVATCSIFLGSVSKKQMIMMTMLKTSVQVP